MNGARASWYDLAAAGIGTLRNEFMWGIRRVVPVSIKQRVRRRLTPAEKIRNRELEATRLGTEGSFGTQIDNMKTWLYAHLPEASAAYCCDITTKQSQKRLARRLGVEVAESYLEDVPLAEAMAFVRRTGLERFVIKPDWSRTSTGRRAVARRGPVYYDIHSGARRRLAGVERAARREYEPLRRPDAWVLEELLLPVDGGLRPVDEYKLYCFGGRVEMLFQKVSFDGRPKLRKQWYDRDWSRVSPLNKDYGSWTQPPENAAEIVTLAEGIASRLCYPFVRLDLYNTSRGIVLGEFTPWSGGRHMFNDVWNDRLLERYREVSTALAEDLRTGRIQPPMPEEFGTRFASA